MSDLRLFRIHNNIANELTIASVLRERHMQKLVEAQMETFFGVRFLASEYATGKTRRGRIDSLGLDENTCPYIFKLHAVQACY